MILFVANDAGPARYISYILEKLNPSSYICLASHISSKVFDEFNIKYTKDDTDIDIKDIKLIFTGTSLGWCIDKKWLEIGKKREIRSISIIEHWSLYKKRFEIDANRYIFPDLILVNDDLAKREAIEDGIDKRLLRVVGNPVLENIVESSYNFKDKIRWKKRLKLLGSRVITFISEEYKSDFPINSKEYIGFNEFKVIDDILNNLDKKDLLLIKLHPEESRDKYIYLLKRGANIKIIDKTDTQKLITFSDILIGMGSILLLEASLIRGDVYSYRPNERIKFIGNRNGMTIPIKNRAMLKRVLNGKIKRGKNFKNPFFKTTDKILDILEEILNENSSFNTGKTQFAKIT